MSRRVYVHIGAPKTGTTYLQDRLGRNLKELAAHDVLFPTRPTVTSAGTFHFRAALDLLDQDWGGTPGHAEGAWDAMVRRVRRANGTVIISHEILAPALPEHVARLKSDLGGGDTEIHVVYSARDLARQVPAGWQESVKQGRRWRYGRYLARVRQGRSWFARAFDLPTVLATWGNGLPPEQVHVVTVPQPVADADPDVLWHRFCRAFGIDPAWAPEDSDRANASLGAAETQVLRALNERIGRSTRANPRYDALILGMLADETLGGQDQSRPILLPPKFHAWARTSGEGWIEWLEQSGVDLIGDTADLLPEPVAQQQGYRHPDRVPSEEQLTAALDALAAMTEEAASRPDPDASVLGRLRRAREAYRR